MGPAILDLLGFLKPVVVFSIVLEKFQQPMTTLLGENMKVSFRAGIRSNNLHDLPSLQSIKGLLGFQQRHRAG